VKDKSILNSSERRKSPRYKVAEPLRISLGKNAVDGSVCNIGRAGMFIRIPNTFLVGTSFIARLALKQPVLINGVIRRVEPGEGVGVSIVAPGAEGRRRLAAFLDTLAPE
jgi:hypothetical protein